MAKTFYKPKSDQSLKDIVAYYNKQVTALPHEDREVIVAGTKTLENAVRARTAPGKMSLGKDGAKELLLKLVTYCRENPGERR